MKRNALLLPYLVIPVLIFHLNDIPVTGQKINIPDPAVNFGTLLQGSYPDASKTFTIQNTGASTLRIDSIGGIKAPFHITNTFPINISAGGSAAITIHLSRNFNEGEYFNRPFIYSNDTSFFNFNKGLTLYYPFNGNAQDSSVSQMHASSYEIEPTSNRFGNPGKAMQFKLTSPFVRVSDSKATRPDSAFSISTWFKVSSLIGGWAILFYRTDLYLATGASNGNPGITFNYNSMAQVYGSSTYGMNEWQHVTITYDSRTFKCYQNGILSSSQTAYIPIVYPNSKDFFIGTSGSYGPAQFGGAIDEFLMYDRVLQAGEVKKLYNNNFIQLTVSAIIEKKQPEISVVSNIVDFGIMRPSTTKDSILTINITNSGDATLIVDSIPGIHVPYSVTPQSFSISPDNSQTLTIRLERNYHSGLFIDTLKLASNIPYSRESSPDLIADYELNANVLDNGPKRLHGFFEDVVPVNDSTAFYFKGVPTSYLSVPFNSAFSVTDEVTIEALIKKDIQNNDWVAILSWDGSSGYGSNYKLGFDQKNGNYFTLTFGGMGSYNTYRTYDGFPSITEWYHVVGVLKANGEAHIYVNGKEAPGYWSEKFCPFGTLPTMNVPIYIGIGPNPGIDKCSYKGIIDNILIYHRALKQDEIWQLYYNKVFKRIIVKSEIRRADPPSNFRPRYEQNSLKLLWNASTENDFDHYTLYRNTSADSSKAVVIATLSKSVTEYIDPDYYPGTDYFYWITSTDKAGFEGYYSPFINTSSDRVLDGILAYYPFNGNPDDATGNAHDGDFGGNIDYPEFFTNDRFGLSQSAWNTSLNDMIFIKSKASSMPFTKAFTFETWVKINISYYEGYIIWKRNNFAFGFNSNNLNTHDDDNFYLYYNDGYKYYYWSTGGGLDIDWENWIHIVGIISSEGYVKLFLNGKELTGTWNSVHFSAGNLHNNDSTIFLSYGTELMGVMDHMAFYNRVLSNDEVKALYETTNPLTSLNFGTIRKMQWLRDSFRIFNPYDETISLKLSLSNSVFTPDINTLQIAPHSFGKIRITFFPQELGVYNDTIYIEHTDYSKPVIIIPVSGAAANQACLHITSDYTLQKSNSPYFITCNLVVDSGATLTVEKGVTLILDSLVNITADGIINAIGTSSEPITFMNDSDDPFNGIMLGNTNCTFQHFIISGAKNGLLCQENIDLSDGIIQNCDTAMVLNASDFNLQRIQFKNNLTGIYSEVPVNVQIDNCSFIGNEFGIYAPSGHYTILDCEFSGNLKYGVNIADNTDKSIKKSRFIDNMYGIYTNKCQFIKENEFKGNKYGISGDYLNIIFNELTENTKDAIQTNNSLVLDNSITNNGGNGVKASNSRIVSNLVQSNKLNGVEGENNIIISNHIMQNMASGIIDGGLSEITGNEIIQNLVTGVTTSGLPVIHENNLYSNTQYEVKATKRDYDEIDARYNWWGTINSSQISNKIYDYFDNGMLVQVKYEPFKSNELNILEQSYPLVEFGDSIFLCSSDSVILDAGNGLVSYLWSTGETSQSIKVRQAGRYFFTGKDQENYSFYSDTVAVKINPSPSVFLGNDTAFCKSLTLDAGGNFNSYQWEDNSTSRIREITESGPRWITVKNNYNCDATDTINLKIQNPFSNEKICIVTADMLSGKNLIVWEKTPDVGTAFYNIYREGGLIGTVNYEDLSIFIDTLVDPRRRPYLYTLSVVDTCSNEFIQGSYHKPLYLQYLNADYGITMHWTKYEIGGEVFDFNSYSIFRGSDSTALVLIEDNIPKEVNEFTDTDPMALQRRFYYRVAGNMTEPCYPTGSLRRKDEPGPYTRSMSNIEDNRILAGNGDIYQSETSLIVYPNPFNESAILRFNNPEGKSYTLYVIDISGKVCKIACNITTSEYILKKGELHGGFYLLELRGSEIIRGSVVIQ